MPVAKLRNEVSEASFTLESEGLQILGEDQGAPLYPPSTRYFREVDSEQMSDSQSTFGFTEFIFI